MTPNWSEISQKDFLEWLSIEGLDGAYKIRHEYDQIPWRLRVAFWTFTHTPSHPLWAKTLLPGINFDQNPEFTRSVSLHFYDCKDDTGQYQEDIALRSHSWLSTLGPRIYSGSEPPPPEITQMATGQVSEDQIQQNFESYEPPDEKYHHRYIPENPTPEFWDTFWENYISPGLPGHDWETSITDAAKHNIPIKYLEEWRNNPHPTRPESASSAVLECSIGHIKSVPAHWLDEINRLEKLNDLKAQDILELYLLREDVPESFRLKYHAHPTLSIKAAALMYGSYTKEYLDGLNITKSGWQEISHQLSYRETLDLPVASMLMENDPNSVELWANREDLSKEIKLLLVQNGYSINWRKVTDQDLLLTALARGPQTIWQDLANHASRHWTKPVIDYLARLIIPLPETSTWTVRRLINLGNLQIDKDLIKLMMTSSSKPIRLLAANNLSSLSVPAKTVVKI